MKIVSSFLSFLIFSAWKIYTARCFTSGAYSTDEGLLKFDQALRSGKLASAATFKQIASPKPELNSPGYGHGFGVCAKGRGAQRRLSGDQLEP